MRHQLLAVTDAEDRSAGRQERGIDGRAARVIDAGGTAGDDDAAATGQLRCGRIAGANLGINAEVTNLAGDEVAVLAAGV
jgi:hypothetical protein